MSLYDEIIADGPEVYFRLGESSGTVAADSSGNGSDAAIAGSTTLGAPSLDANSVDTAFEFAAGDYVQLDNPSSYGLSFTAELMFRADGLEDFATATAHNGAILTYSTDGVDIENGFIL